MTQIAAMDPATFVAAFREPPGIHRFGQMMAERTLELAAYLVKHYSGRVTNLWADSPTDAVLHKRFEQLPGFGPSKAGVLINALELFGHRSTNPG